MWTRSSLFNVFLSVGYVIMLIAGLLLKQRSAYFYFGFATIWFVVCLVGAFLFKRLSLQASRKGILKQQKQVDAIKQDGEQIVVDLRSCKILSNAYVDEQEANGPPIMATADLPSHAYKNIRKVDVVQSVIQYEHNRNGVKEVFTSPVIPIDKVSLLFLLGAQKETRLYVDKADRSRYYFNLDFLNK